MSKKVFTTDSIGKPTVGVFLFGVPEFETLYHLLKRLQERGELELKLFLPSSLTRLEPRVPKLLKEARLPYRTQHSKIMKHFYWGCFRGLNAELGISDPFMDYQHTRKKRNRYLIKINLPTIFVQHGVIQTPLNVGNPLDWGLPNEQIEFYSAAAFLMEYPTQTQQKFFTDSALARIEISGFIKKPCFPPKSIPPSMASQLSKYDARLLICHSLRSNEFDVKEIQPFYSMIEKFANDNPQIGIIVRPHRGKRRKRYEAQDRKLENNTCNVHFMYHHHGPLKRMSITDALSIIDLMISTPSTAILDAIYMGKPVAVCLNYHTIFEGLPQIVDADSIDKFVSDAKGNQQGADQIVARYGNLDKNIEQTCAKIEQIVSRVST